MQINQKIDKVDKSSFEFVQRDHKIYDKKFETKPIGYFKDAMIRFTKNKTNVVATVILFTLITLSVFIPILTSKNYVDLESRLSLLPPRIPIVERFGLFDGTRIISGQEVDLSTIDPETGIGLPFNNNYAHDFIVPGSVTNEVVSCTGLNESCVGGTVRITLRDASLRTMYRTNSLLSFSLAEATPLMLNVDVNDMSDTSTLNLLMRPDFISDYEVIATITEPGDHSFNLVELLGEGFLSTELRVQLEATETGSYVELHRIELREQGAEEAEHLFEGFNLATLGFVANSGSSRINRSSGELLLANFRFDSYGRALGPWRRPTFSAERFYELMETNAESCGAVPTNPVGHDFPEGCPVIEVLGRTESVIVGGVERYSYDLILDFATFRGFDDTPFFFFGTTVGGRDLFALTWVALRTSLLIGLAAAFINITVGIIYGSISGYYGGKVDILMERFSELVARIPFLVVLAIMVAYFGAGITTLIVVLIVSGWIGVASVTRTQFYRYKGREYVLASRTLGAKDSRLIFRHILPNGIGTIITASVLMIPLVIFTESTLSFLGFGIGHGQSFNIGPFEFSGVSIGVLLADGREEMLNNPHLTYFPAIIISILMITFNMFGNALRDAFNPSLRGSE